MTKLIIPAALSNAVKQGEELEDRIMRTNSALITANDRAERAGAELLQAEAERDQLAGARDLAAAAEAMGEVPEVDTAELKKRIATAEKRLSTARTEADNARSAARGLELRLTREKAERPAILQAIQAGQAEARGALRTAAEAVCADLAREAAARLGPIAAAEPAVDGWEIAHGLKSLALPFQPEGRSSIREEIRAASAPPEFARAGALARQLTRVIETEAA